MSIEPAAEIARHWIDGAWVASKAIGASLNPSTGTILGRLSDGGADEARSGICRARGHRAMEEFQEIKMHFLVYQA